MQQPVRLTRIDASGSHSEAQVSRRPPTAGGPPVRPERSNRASSQRPHTSTDRVPQSRVRDRPGGSRRPPRTSEVVRHSSHGGQRSSTARQRSQILSIPEQQYTEDRTIIRTLTNLIFFIDQHTEYYYLRNGPNNQFTTEFADSRTRHPEIRRYIAREIIDNVIMVDRNRFEIAVVSKSITPLIRYKVHQTHPLSPRGWLYISNHILILLKNNVGPICWSLPGLVKSFDDLLNPILHNGHLARGKAQGVSCWSLHS